MRPQIVEALTTRVVAREELQGLWPEMEETLLPALKDARGELTINDILRFLQEGACTAFVTLRKNRVELTCVVECMAYPSLRVVNILALGGKNLNAAARFLPALEAWALAMGAVEIRGWASNPAIPRLYKRLGLPFQPIATVLGYNLRSRLQ